MILKGRGKMVNWYKLDVAANLFPSVTTENHSSVFRMSAVMSEKIDCVALQEATNKIMPAFPMLFTRMNKGVFWNYLATNSKPFVVKEEKNQPCEIINITKNNGYLMRILYFGNRISVEFYHALTDGTGATEFLKSLLFYYITIKYGAIPHQDKIILHNDYIEEFSTDSYYDYFNEGSKKESFSKEHNAYHFKGSFYNNMKTAVISGTLSAKELSAVAKKYGGTITAYLTSVYIFSTYNSLSEREKKLLKKPIVISVPVNLRKIFPSKSLRNFAGNANISYVMNKSTTFQELFDDVKLQLAEKTTKEEMTKWSSHNVYFTENKLIKGVPVPIKQLVLGMIFKNKTEHKKTTTLSNVGKLSLPDEMEKYIKQFEMLLYPAKNAPVKLSVATAFDTVTINFTKNISESDVIRHFFKFMSTEDELNITITTNEWGEDYA